jgi:hypothetical protein
MQPVIRTSSRTDRIGILTGPLHLSRRGVSARPCASHLLLALGTLISLGLLGLSACDNPAAPDPTWDAMRPDPATSDAPYRIYNIGNNNPVKLTEYIAALEEALGRKAEQNLLPLQPGDVPDTFADVSDLERNLGYKPRTTVQEGVANFVKWYTQYMAQKPD